MKTIPKMISPSLENAHWRLDIQAHTGAIARLGHPTDPHGMNWVCDSAENLAFPDSHGWGLGFLAVPGGNGPQRWQRPEEVTLEDHCSRARYQVGAIEVTITRRLHGDRFDETFEFRNPTASELAIWGIGLYAPFNDNYPDALTCVTRRCNAHLWCVRQHRLRLLPAHGRHGPAPGPRPYGRIHRRLQHRRARPAAR
jgi:hypothetical protein